MDSIQLETISNMLIPERTIQTKEKYVTYVVGLICCLMLLRSGIAGLVVDPPTCIFFICLFSYIYLGLSEKFVTGAICLLILLHVGLFASQLSHMTETTAILLFYTFGALAVVRLKP